MQKHHAYLAAVTVAILLAAPAVTLAQNAHTGGTLQVQPADDASLEEVAPAPTSRSALPERQPLRPEVDPGARFKNGSYRGVVPGENNLPPQARRLKRTRRNFVTWPGFEMTEGGSRFFVQSTRPVEYSRTDEQGRIIITLRNSRIHLRNNRNPLVTEHFNTPVARASLRHRRRNTQLVLEMKVEVTPTIRQVSQGDYHFLFIEFPAGNYPIPTTVRQPNYRPGEGGVMVGDPGGSGSVDWGPPE